MNMFVWNLLLALVWAFMTGQFTPSNFLVGFVLGYAILLPAQRVVGRSPYFRRVRRLLAFVVFFLWEVVLANLRVAYAVIAPRPRLRPGVLAIPLEAQSDLEITMLANCITLTPGTLSLDVSDDRRVLYIHDMFIDDPEAERRAIKTRLERRIVEIFRDLPG